MPATVRNRSFNPLVPGGTWGPTTQTYRPRVYRSQDVVGDYGGLHSFDLEKGEKFPNGVSGTVSGQVLNGWIPLRFSSSEMVTHLSIPRQYSDVTAVTKTMASSNPNKPVVSIPVFIAELKDIPQMIFSIGETLLGRHRNFSSHGKRNLATVVGAGYLGASFGWFPLIGDLVKLYHFQDSVEKKIKELNRMYDRGGIRRKRILQRDSAQRTDGPWPMNTNGGLVISATSHRVTTYTEWCTVRWNIKQDSKPRPTDMEIRRKSENIVRGTVWMDDPWAVASDLWQLTPWSWLTDWFTNIGDYLDAHRGYVPVEASRGCVMSTTETTAVFTRTSGNATTKGGDGTIKRKTLKRRIVSTTPTFEAGVPFLTAHQTSILGSLAAVRAIDRR